MSIYSLSLSLSFSLPPPPMCVSVWVQVIFWVDDRSWFRDRDMCPLFLLAQFIPSGDDTSMSCTCCLSPFEFVCASLLLIQKVLFPWCPPFLLALKIFCHFFMVILALKEDIWWQDLFLEWVFQGLTHTSYWLVESLYLSSYEAGGGFSHADLLCTDLKAFEEVIMNIATQSSTALSSMNCTGVVFSFVHDDKYGFICIVLYTDIQFNEYHLFKMLSFPNV